MVGLGETYLPAFVLALGFGAITSGWVATIPLLAGAFLQLLTPRVVAKLRSFKRWVLLCASLQALSFVPLIYGAVHASLPWYAVFLAASLYWGAGMGAGPGWNAWMGALIPIRQRTHFWGRRTLMAQVGSLVGFVGGGLILAWFPHELAAFTILFALALFFRILSVYWLRSHPEPEAVKTSMVPPTIASARRIVMGRHTGKFIRFVLFLNMSVHVAAPFFTPYMLVQLDLGYLGFVLLTATSFVAKIISLPWIGSRIEKHGPTKVIWMSGFGIVFLPMLWLISSDLVYLTFLQILAGVFWAGVDLSFPLLILEMVSHKERLGILTLYNLGRSFALVVGSLVGGVLLQSYGEGLRAYVIVFTASTLLRMASLLIVASARLPPLKRVPLFSRTTAIRPSQGSFSPPVVDSGTDHRNVS